MGMHDIRGPLTREHAEAQTRSLIEARRDLHGFDVIVHARTGAQLQAVDALAEANLPAAFWQMWRAVAYDRAVRTRITNHDGMW
jgi:hypothetical protein